MHVTHRKRFVSRDLVALAARRPQELAALSEAHYHDQIESIADEVLAAGQRIVMLTGPSAAGKTTSAHKIADAIAACGHRSQVISLDDFYIGEGKYPKNPDGSDDYESLEALDLERLHACLKALYKTGVCDAPVFDFTIQRPSGTQRIDARDGVVIIEGLHALNPALTEELPEDAALCLYAGLREEYADSRDARCLATRDIRLARRLVRDCLTEREADIIRRRYGLEGHPPQTQRQVAAVYGISRSYVSRIEKRALEKLEQAMRE